MAVKNANTNPWYVLMTLYGEQVDSGFRNGIFASIDNNIDEENRRLWNAWAGNFLQSRNREKLDTRNKIPESEFECEKIDWREVRSRHRYEMIDRNDQDFQYPGFPDDEDQISLRDIEFDHLICWDGFYFPLTLHLNGSIFNKGACSNGTVFSQGVYLDGVRFLNNTQFDSSWFKSASFNDTVFSGAALFSGVEFSENVKFNNVRFGLVSFRSAKFFTKHPKTDPRSGAVNFSNTVFEKSGDFCDSIFGAGTLFISVGFLDNASFDRAKFFSAIVFSRTNFDNRVSFKAAHFLSDRSTQLYHYLSTISFSSVDFKAPTSFEDALFESDWPSFESTVLHTESVFSPNDECWPSVESESNLTGQKTCSKIRKNQSSQGLIDGEHFFFRREMGFQMNSCSPGKRLLFLGYGFFSDFGRSISRPLWSMFILWLVGVVAIAGYLSSCCALSPEEFVQRPWGTAVALSFSNLFPMFGFGRTYLDWVNLPTALEVYSAVQSVFSLPLIFFWGLGLRHQFKIDR